MQQDHRGAPAIHLVVHYPLLGDDRAQALSPAPLSTVRSALDQLPQILSSTTHIQEDQSQLGVLARQHGEHSFLTHS